jgi:hypothetical protein
MSGVIPNRGVTHLRVGDELGWIKREKKQELPEVFRTCPMEIGGQRNMFRGPNELRKVYLILISVIND